MHAPNARQNVLLLAAAGRRCAVHLESVVETLRPLPTEPLAGLPGFVLGAAVVRGMPAPVADLSQLLGAGPGQNRRWVSLRLESGPAMLSVDQVHGVFDLSGEALALAPLLGGGSSAVEALRVRDAGLLAVLEAARLVPDTAFAALRAATGPRA